MDKGTSPPPFASDHRGLGLIEVLGPSEAEVFNPIGGPSPNRSEVEIRGILIRAGRAGFYYWMKQNWEIIGWNDQVFRFQPVKRKITSGIKSICDWLEKDYGEAIWFRNEESSWVIEIPGHMNTTEAVNRNLCCYLRGFVQEFTQWAGIGKFYVVREESCAFKGSESCVIRIMKEPTD